MGEPPDQMPAAAGRGDLRASDADREQVIATLTAAFVQGRLAKDEFDLRVGQTLVSRTYTELAAVTADLPAGLTIQPPKPAQAPARPARRQGKRPVLARPVVVGTAASAIYAAMWPLAFFLPTSGDGYPTAGVNLVGSATLFYMLILIVSCVWAQVLGSRRAERSGSQRPGRPPAQAARRLPSADLGAQLPAADRDDRHRAEAARRRPSRRSSWVHGHCAGGTIT